MKENELSVQHRGGKVMAHHPISHIEIPAENPNEVSAFYRDVFGWKIETNAEHNYVTYQDGGSLRGGFPGPGEPTYKPDRLLVYLATDDIDASLADVEAHGGKTVLPKTEVAHVGWWAVFADPAGNYIGLFARRSTSK
jgi:predicted enzyme related to lactoylglutathione lyase